VRTGHRFARVRGAGVLALVVALWLAGPAASAQAPLAETSVGMTGRLEAVVIPGPEVEAKPLADRKSPVVVRVVRVFPHGTAFRYDLEYFGLDPGTHDLRDHLRRKDGSPAGDLPPLPVKVNPVRPPGQVEPNPLTVDPGPRLGGYRTLAVAAGVVWVVGLLALVASFFFPRRKRRPVASERPVTLADRLRPLVEGAVAGKLSQGELAGLERALLAYWRMRLGLEHAEPGAAMDVLRADPRAGPLLAQLEAWLHRPGPPAPVDVPALLAPYRDLPPEAIDLTAPARKEAVA
jgi:hypothetical protein